MDVDSNVPASPYGLNTDTLQITPEMLFLVAGIEEFKGAWCAACGLTAERLKALQRAATIDSIGASMRIEGGALSDKDIERLMSKAAGAPPTREQSEVAGYADVMARVCGAWRDFGLTEADFLRMHHDLMDAGTAAGAPLELPPLMRELIAWLGEARGGGHLHPLLIIGVFTAVFLDVRPFPQGNGRMSRILMTLLLMQAGHSYVPYGSLASIIERDKNSYYAALRATQATIRGPAPDWQPWLDFFLRTLRQQQRHLAAAVEREKEANCAQPELRARILDQVRVQGRVTIGDMIASTGRSRNTLKEHFKRLAKQGTLLHHGKGRGSWYGVP